jgi:hypothetical protein
MFILSQVYSIFDLVSGRVLGWIILEGDDRPNVLQYKALTQDPSKHELYGMSMKWETAVDDIPQGLDSKEFEDWLWRREEPEQPEQPVEIDTGHDMVPRLSKEAVDRQLQRSAGTGQGERAYSLLQYWQWQTNSFQEAAFHNLKLVFNKPNGKLHCSGAEGTIEDRATAVPFTL